MMKYTAFLSLSTQTSGVLTLSMCSLLNINSGLILVSLKKLYLKEDRYHCNARLAGMKEDLKSLVVDMSK